MSTFNEIFKQYDWATIQNKIYQTTATDVENSLSKKKCTLTDFLHLIAPAAADYLEIMAQKSSVLEKPFKCMLHYI